MKKHKKIYIPITAEKVMSKKEFFYNLLSVFVPMLGGALYLYIRSFYAPIFSQISYEIILIKKNPQLIKQLQNTTWNANLGSVSIVASILVAVVSMVISYFYTNKRKESKRPSLRKDYFLVYRNIILFIVSLGMILSALSMQFWIDCMDYGRPVNDYINARIYGAITNLLSWLCVYTAVFMLISLVSRFTASLISLTSSITFIIYQEWRIYYYTLNILHSSIVYIMNK